MHSQLLGIEDNHLQKDVAVNRCYSQCHLSRLEILKQGSEYCPVVLLADLLSFKTTD